MTGAEGTRSGMGALFFRAAPLVFFVICLLPLSLHAEDAIDVKRDADKTVYTIGPDTTNKREEEKERDRAWDMLNQMDPNRYRGKGGPWQGEPPAPPSPPPSK